MQYKSIACKDRLGHWFKGWCTYWDRRGELGSRAARADLEAVLILLQEDMAEIEAKHAATRRELYVLSTQTNTSDFLELSDRHVLRTVRRQPGTYGVAPHRNVGIDVAAAATDESSDSDGEPDTKRQRTGGYRHWLSEYTSGSDKGCAQKGLGDVWAALPAETRARHERASHVDVQAAIAAGGRGYRPTKKLLQSIARRKTATEKVALLRQSGDLDPMNACAASALDALNLSDRVDFDDGIRTIKRGLRDATIADGVSMALQNEVISTHDRSSRDNAGLCNGLPKDIQDVLGTNWHSVPHTFHGTLRHLRGSFPAVTKAVGTLMSANQKKKVPLHMAEKLLEWRRQLHQPAQHDKCPVVTAKEAAPNDLVCNVAGFCVHGSEGVLIKAIHASLMKAICSERFPKTNTAGRGMLTKSGVVICAISEQATVTSGPVGIDGVEPEPIVSTLTKWAHLGAVNLLPRGFQCQIMCRCDGSQLYIGSYRTEATLEVQWEFHSAWSFVRYLDKTLVWSLRFFTFVESPRLLGTLSMKRVSVTELAPWPRDAGRELVFWSGHRSIAAARNAHQKKEFKLAVVAANALAGSGFESSIIIRKCSPNGV